MSSITRNISCHINWHSLVTPEKGEQCQKTCSAAVPDFTILVRLHMFRKQVISTAIDCRSTTSTSLPFPNKISQTASRHESAKLVSALFSGYSPWRNIRRGLRFYLFSVKIVENACNFVNSSSIYIKISAS
jgi:hypothetical protein